MARQRSVSRALTTALKATATQSADTATIALAVRYAAAIDADEENALLWRLGPRLLDTLTELGMTPAARAVVKGVAGDNGGNPALDELRARRERRRGAG